MLIFDDSSNMDVSQFLDEDFGLDQLPQGRKGVGGGRRGEIGGSEGGKGLEG